MKRTEITVQVFENYNEIHEKLTNQGFMVCDKFIANDFYFSKYPIEKLKTMEYIDIMNNTIIVRKFFNDEIVYVEEITFKKKELDLNNNVISEEKFEAKVDSVKDTVNVLKMSGLCMWCEIYNNVYTYQKENLVFDVHCVKDLGVFIECEDNETMNGLTSEQKFEQLSNIIKSLNLKIGADFSCKKVFMKFKNEIK